MYLSLKSLKRVRELWYTPGDITGQPKKSDEKEEVVAGRKPHDFPDCIVSMQCNPRDGC